MPSKRAGPAEVDEYLAGLPPVARARLSALRQAIRAAAPEAEETIGYRMPTFRHHGNLVHFAAFSDHYSLFPGSIRIREKFRAELAGFPGGPGTIQFTEEHPLPLTLVRRIVKERVRQNEAAQR